MAPADRWFRKFNEFLVSEHPNSRGEWRGYCPIHEDPKDSKTPSATFNFEKALFNCNAGCGGSSLASLARDLGRDKADTGPSEAATYDPFQGSDVASLDDARARKRGEKRAPLSEGLVLGWHQALMKNTDALTYLVKKRGLTTATIEQYQLGWEQRAARYTIPVRDEDGRLVNVRRYRPDADAAQKMWNLLGHGSPPRLFPLAVLEDAEEVLVVEGEMDALINIQNGIPAVTGTGGAGRWDPSWNKFFEGKRVVFSYDNDRDGRVGAKKASQSVRKTATSVGIIPLLREEDKSDSTDFYLGGGTADQLRELMAQATVQEEPEAKSSETAEAVPVQVIGSMDSQTNGRALAMNVTITGKRNPTYSVPARAGMSCTMDAGPKCKVCTMQLDHEGEYTAVIDPMDITTISRFIDASEDKTLDLLRRHIGAQKCNRLRTTVVEAHTVEEIFVTGSVDRRSIEGHDYTQRRIYNIGAHDTPTNTTANVIGTTWPSPKDRRNEFFSWELSEASTSIDHFTMTPELRMRLSIFQPAEGQTPEAKCREIAIDLSHNVTKIIGRERLHIAMDLVYHSVLHFPLDDKIISRGWIEFIVVGDTRTGKSETAIRLTDHYGLGHVIGCEGATFAGLVGAVKQIGDAWTVTWGEITINDRRLVVLDEASGLSQDIIGQLSDIRSRGVAQLTKVESQETRARCRMIWISNARKNKHVDEKKVDGIDVLEDLIGNPEDIARFDIAMSVSMSDVASSKINSPEREQVPHIYTAELCRELILWAWSRKPDQIQWKPDAYSGVYEGAEWLGKKYVDHPPLIQRTNVREKIARIAVAFATRTFSCDDSGENVVVERRHVKAACEFIDALYSYDNFGYERLSRRTRRNRAIARKNREAIRVWLRENPRLLEFLLDRRGSFRSQDLEEMAYMQRDEVNNVLGRLSDAKMISKDKSQIVIEPELHKLLKEMEK